VTAGATILNVDDYAASRYARAKVLTQAGYDVLDAASGREALELVAARRPDLVLLDLDLPDIDGYGVCAAIKRAPETRALPVVHITAAFRRTPDHVRSLELGADGCLVEPVEPEVLLATVRSLLRGRAAEEETRRAAAQWQMTLDAIGEGVCLVDADGRIARHNGLFSRLVGGPGDLVGHDAREVLREALGEAARHLPRDAPLAAGGRGSFEAAAGSRWLQVTAHPLGEAGGAVVTLADVTERKRIEQLRTDLLAMEQRARAAAETVNRAKDEFLAILSHELRTPLMAILGWVRILGNENADAKIVARAAEVIERNTRMQAQIVEDLLDVSRIIAGKLAIAVSPTALEPVVAAAIDSVRGAAAAKRIAITLAADPEVGVVPADSVRMAQVVSNLLSNAVKFTPPGGSVRVSLERQDAEVHLAVTDTGQGIEHDMLPHVFDRFRQAEVSYRRSQSGLGLGLTIARHIVEMHGGRIDVASPGPGRGATFTVRLPAALPRSLPLPATPAAPPASDLTGLRVLVVEDDDDTREVVSLILQRSGASVVVADTAAAALAAFQAAPPDLLLSDIGLPGEDGYDLIRGVRALPSERGGAVPAIALTAFARGTDSGDALLAGYNRHVAKPVDPERLAATVAEVARLGKPRG
jgi:signal transduction histidine kinase